MATEIPGVEATGDCECFPGEEPTCICGPTERMLRRWSNDRPGPKMTPAQRAWCKDQVQGIECGDWPGNDATDGEIARAVLDAWRTYARDKGTY